MSSNCKEETVASLLAKGIPTDGFCLEWSLGCSAGYGEVSHKGVQVRVHRLMYMLKHPDEDIEGKEIRHICDNPKCFNPDHLISGTHAMNMKDMAEHGNATKGSKHHNAKLSDEQVREIKFGCYGLSQDRIASMYGITQAQVSMILAGKRWAHIKEKQE